MINSQKLGITLGALIALGLAGINEAQAVTLISSGQLQNVQDLTLAKTAGQTLDGYYLYNFQPGGAGPLSNVSSPVSYLSSVSANVSSNGGGGGVLTNPSGKINSLYSIGSANLGIFTVNSFVPTSFTVGFIDNERNNPVELWFFQYPYAGGQISVSPTQSTTDQADVQLFTVTGAVAGQQFAFYTRQTDRYNASEIGGLTFSSVPASPEPSQLAGIAFAVLGAFGLILKARKRSLGGVA